MNSKFIIGIDLGGTKIKAALLNTRLQIQAHKAFVTNSFESKGLLIKGIADIVAGLIKENGLKRENILGLGVGMAGPVDSQNGRVHFLPNISGWENVPLAAILRDKLKLPVFLDNDAKLMALAEYNSGKARFAKNALCITLGTGVGGGLILNGELFRGLDNAAGEIGHLPINVSGPDCACGGKACLEAYVGNKRILALAKKVFQREISLEELSRLAALRNKKAVSVWLQVGEYLGVALSAAVNLLNLDAIIIGGGVADAGKVLFEQVKRTIHSRAMPVQSKRVKILKAGLGNHAGMIGAGVLVKERLGI
jgi:glucokinase